MKKERKRYFLLPLLLLALFLTYQVGTMAFTHVHIVNGVMLVHSHASSDNRHTHTTEQVITIAQLSHVQTLEADLPSPVSVFLPVIYELECQTNTFHVKAPHTHSVQLRAPPFC